jgi:hypothetical protein
MNRALWAALAGSALLGCRGAAPPAVTPDAAPTATVAAAPEASPTGPSYKNTVRWSTASELDNFGFDVYRATRADGPFERLTKDPIAGAVTSDVVHAYSYVDETIDPHQTYFYYVESITLSGVRERFTPVVEAKPKLPAGDSAPAPAPTP